MIAGRYTLEAEIGRGGMGAVWRGRDEVLGRTVALKKVGVAPGGVTPDAVRAEREAKLAAKLSHANVVAVFDLVDDGAGVQWLVMEYVRGTDLAELVRQRGRLGPDEAAPILAQTAAALAAAHAAGIVHRDVKPSNILVTPDGQVKLSDFGIARISSDPSLTQTGLVTGSPAYLSPEVASGAQASPASDAWSWGATLFHALEGHPPYQVGDNLLGALYRIVHEEPPRSAYAGWLAPALVGTMTRDPAQRWPIASAQGFLDAGPQAPSDSAPAPEPVGAGGLAALGLADAGGDTRVLSVTRSAEPPPPPVLPASEPPTADEGEATRRAWLVVAVGLTVLVIVVVAAFAAGLGRGGDDTADDPGGDTSTATGTGSEQPSPSGSASATAPTADAMESFVRDYVATAVRDPASAFQMLTPDFQEASGGFARYDAFWGSVRNARIQTISADPDALTVRYRYRYVRPGGPTTEAVVLHLVTKDDTFLVDGED